MIKKHIVNNKNKLLIMSALIILLLIIGGIKKHNINAQELVTTGNSSLKNSDETIVPKNENLIKFRETELDVKTGLGNKEEFDENDEPGNDSSPDNDVVRSFDNIQYEYTLNLDSVDGKRYTDIKIHLTGTVVNGVTSNGRQLNAKFSELAGGRYDEDNKNSLIDTIVDKSSDGTITTGSKNIILLPLEVYGASNGLNLNVKLKAQIIEAKNDKGEIIRFEGETIELPDGGPIRVSSKVNFQVNSGRSDSNVTYDFDNYVGVEDSQKRLKFLGISVGIVPLPGKKDFKGVAFPDSDSPVTVKVSQKIERSPANKNEWTTLPLTGESDTSTLPMEVFTYGRNTEAPTGEVLGAQYPDKDMKNKYNEAVYVPYGFRAAGNIRNNAVKDTGIIKMKDNGDTTFDLSYEKYKIDNLFPDKRYGTSSPSAPYTEGKYFLASAYTLAIPIDALHENEKLKYNLHFESITYTEESNGVKEEKVQLSNSETSWEEVLYPKGVISLFSALNDSQKKTLGTNITSPGIPVRGDAAAYKGQEIIGRTSVTPRTADFPGGVKIIQKWNPKALEFDPKRPVELTVSRNPTLNIKDGYGVSKEENYSLDKLNKNHYEDYDWYETYEEAIKNGKISAFMKDITSVFPASGATIMYVPLIVIGDFGTTEKEDGSPHVLLSNVEAYYRKDRSEYIKLPSERNINYQLTTYNTEGKLMGNHTPSGVQGDTLQIIDYKLAIFKSSHISKDNLKEKLTFSSSEIATYVLKPVVEGKKSENDKIKIKIKDILPKGMNYKLNSAEFNGKLIEPAISENSSSGSTTLQWELEVAPGTDLGNLIYQVNFTQSEINFGGANATTLDNTAIISTNEGVNSDELSRTATATVNVLKEAGWDIRKTVNKSTIEASDNQTPITYTIRLANQTGRTQKNVNIIDVLPSVNRETGDKLSEFHGNYRLKELKVMLTDEKTENTAATSHYTNELVKRETDPNTIKGSATWDDWEMNNGGLIDKEVQAIFVELPEIKDNEYAYVKVTIQPENNWAGDTYINQASANSAGSSSPIHSEMQKTSVVNRKILGRVWHDDNYSGGIDNDESFFENVGVVLYSLDDLGNLSLVDKNLKNETFIDDAGKSMILTDKDGEYVFEGLPKGNYVVGFNLGDEVKKGKLFISEPNAPGILSSLTSKVSLTEVDNQNLLTPRESNYELPGIDEINEAEYVVNFVNLGVLRPATLNIRQVVLNDHKDLVIPESGYFTLSNEEEKDNSKSINGYQLKTGSSLKDNFEEITQELFTKSSIKLLNGQWGIKIKDVVPEYYEYVGAIKTTNGENIANDHLSSSLNKDDNKNMIFVDFKEEKEYWVTVYIQPKFGTDINEKLEDGPRPYSWDLKTNSFGVLKP